MDVPLEPSAPPLPDMISPDRTALQESSFEHSSPISSEPSEKGLGSPFDIHQIEEAASYLPDLLQSSTTSIGEEMLQSQTEEVNESSLPNGPTEVEYNPEIDVDYSPSAVTSDIPIMSASPSLSLNRTTFLRVCKVCRHSDIHLCQNISVSA